MADPECRRRRSYFLALFTMGQERERKSRGQNAKEGQRKIRKLEVLPPNTHTKNAPKKFFLHI